MKNVLIIGLGRFGSAMVKPFADLGNAVVVCDTNEEKIAKVLPYTAAAKIGDATSEAFVAELGVENFDLTFVAIGGDIQDSLVAVTLLKDFGAKYIIAKAGSEMHEKLLTRVGADRTIFPEREAGQRTASILGRTSVFERIELEDGYAVYEIEVPQAWVGKTLKDLNLRAKYGLNVLGVKESDTSPLHPDFKPNLPFAAGMRVMLMGKNEELQQFLA
ncbi:MAG: TrkA family potassium uptake protein [Clostridia bacterium]|nr:TrkA family potassium uptake protein [Clostridia bacterium]